MGRSGGQGNQRKSREVQINTVNEKKSSHWVQRESRGDHAETDRSFIQQTHELSLSHTMKWEKSVLLAFLHSLSAHAYCLLISLPLTSPISQFPFAVPPATTDPTI